MNLNNVKMLVSAVKPSQYPQNNIPDIAFAGRSNVGKSSMINKLLNRKNLARVSSNPGKTATINFFEVDETFNLVDLPGYGFAKVSKAEKEKWGKMIEEYLFKREELIQVVLLVDMRHKPSNDDVLMYNWIKESGFNPLVIATKHDKLRPSLRDGALQLIKDTLNTEFVIPFSSEKGTGRDEVWSIIENLLNGVVDTKQEG